MPLGTIVHLPSSEQLELLLDSRGEAPRALGSGEVVAATHGTAHSGSMPSSTVLEQVMERKNLVRALQRVQRNQGSPGVDGLTVEALPAYLKQHWPVLRAQLLAGTYQPSAVKRVEIPKPGGGMRLLGIPTVVDRCIQQAILQVLQPQIDPTFSEASFGFRPNRRAHDAIRQAQRFVQSGRCWVVDVDLEKFFDRVNHDVLMGKLAAHIPDARVLRLIRRYLTAGLMADGVVQVRHEGTPQGGPLSPLLANVLLDTVDKALERRQHCFVRYADDCNVYVRSQRAAERVMEGLVRLYAKLRLRVNVAKSAVARAWERSFLGYSFWIDATQSLKRRVAPKALIRLKARLRELTSRMGGRSVAQVVAALRPYLAGWRAYFRLADTPRELGQVDGWLRRRLRLLMVKQCKRGPTLFRLLRNRRVPLRLSSEAAAHCARWWATAAHAALHTAFPNRYFDSLGLPRLGAS
jgi:RNA-directed DNA polymerase